MTEKLKSLTPFRCSVHTHSTLCDGSGTPAEMASAACRAGIAFYGFSGHSHTTVPCDDGNTLPKDPAEYKKTALALREEYAGRMEILLGIEWDSVSDGVREGFDYWIGSVHHLRGPDGTYYTVDWTPEALAECRDNLFGGDPLAMAEGYYKAAAEMAAQKPTILGHIDLVTKYNAGGRFFDESDTRYRNAALSAIHAADPAATLLEINTGAMARGYRTTPYPAPFLLEEWRKLGGRVIVTADAHRPDALLYGYAEAVQAARAAGFRECAVLTASGVRDCPLE